MILLPFSICIILIYIIWRLYGKYQKIKLSYDNVQKETQIVLSFLQEIGTAFTEAIDLDELLHSVVSRAVRILKAASGAVFLVDESKGYLQASIIEGTFPPWYQPDPSVMEKILSKTKYLDEYLKGQKITIGTGLIGTAAGNGRACLISNADMDTRIPKFSEDVLAIRTMMLVPLKIRDSVLGVLVLVNKENNQPFTETDLNLLQALGDQAAIAIRNARFYKTILEKQKLDHDLSIARDIQHMLLPRTYPVINNWDISVLSKTAMEIGGDYYDFIDVGKDKLGLVIADVSGKSIPGALVMSMTRSVLRSKAMGVHSASSVLMAVNELVCQDIEPDMFISLVYLIIDTRQNTVTYARAGHEPIIFFHAKESALEQVKPEGMVLGMDSGPLFNNSLREINLQMHPGDALILYTDGITEAVNDKQEEFGLTNLMDAIKISSPGTAADIVNNISERISRFTGNLPQQDDLTLVVLKLKT